MNFEAGPIFPRAGRWYVTRAGLTVKVVADDLPSQSGHTILAIHYQPSSWSLQTLLPTGKISDQKNMPEDILYEAFDGADYDENQ